MTYPTLWYELQMKEICMKSKWCKKQSFVKIHEII